MRARASVARRANRPGGAAIPSRAQGVERRSAVMNRVGEKLRKKVEVRD
jgi:hypothetical protein